MPATIIPASEVTTDHRLACLNLRGERRSLPIVRIERDEFGVAAIVARASTGDVIVECFDDSPIRVAA